MKVTIDRFEGEFAVVEKEDRAMLNIRRERLPQGAREGDILIIEGDSITIDKSGTANRKQRINNLMADLWEKKKD